VTCLLVGGAAKKAGKAKDFIICHCFKHNTPVVGAGAGAEVVTTTKPRRPRSDVSKANQRAGKKARQIAKRAAAQAHDTS